MTFNVNSSKVKRINVTYNGSTTSLKKMNVNGVAVFTLCSTHTASTESGSAKYVFEQVNIINHIRYSKCSTCGEKIPSTATTVEHTFDKTEEVIIDATCSSEGSKTITNTCKYCGYEYSRNSTIDKLEHNWVLDSAAVAPTCTSDGSKEKYKCTKCEETKGGEIDPALGHNYYVAGEFVSESPTCTKPGKKDVRHVCSNGCGDSYDEYDVEVSALGHKWSTYWNADAYAHWHECTRSNCDVPTAMDSRGVHVWNSSTGKCSVCGTKCSHANVTRKRYYMGTSTTYKNGYHLYANFCDVCGKQTTTAKEYACDSKTSCSACHKNAYWN